MELREELEIAKSRIMEEINFIDDNPSARSGLKMALEILNEECPSNVSRHSERAEPAIE